MEFRNSYVQQTCYIARAIPKCIVTDYFSVTYPKNYIDVTNLGKIGRVASVKTMRVTGLSLAK